VTGFDPIAREEAHKVFGDNVVFREDLADALRDAEAVLLMTRWPQFEQLPELVKNLAAPPLVIDGRRMLARTALSRYEGIGLGAA
jgi:UDPglucose 6-dehydrogenase